MKKIILLTALFFGITKTVVGQSNEERNFQFSFITPIGTNGINSHLITNRYSVNLLGGYSYGNTVLELGGIYNINTHNTSGAQLAGVINYSGMAENAVQLAGVANVVGEGNVGTQLGGTINLVVQGNALVQIGGVANLAPLGEVGTQISGVINVAKRVKGVQLGLINYVEDADGLPIGLINIVKNNGKYEFELSFSEAIHTSLSFKMGTSRFYTIFSGGINYIDCETQFATGLGFGTEKQWRNGWGNQIELMGYSLTENKKFHDVNILNQLKLYTSKQISEHFKVFAGPVLNVTVSDYKDPETGKLGSSLSPWSLWKNKSEKTRVNGWIGFSAGVRF